MNIVIVGCGRVGATLAADLDARGHVVTILDISTRAFDRLAVDVPGERDPRRRHRRGHPPTGREPPGADVFLALTEGDNRNVMAAQLAAEALEVGQVVAKINDPVRAEAYSDLGIATICRTDLMTHALLGYMGLPVGPTPKVREAAPHPHPGSPFAVAGGAAVGAPPAEEA